MAQCGLWAPFGSTFGRFVFSKPDMTGIPNIFQCGDPHALHALALALDEAKRFQNKFIEPEHLLLGLIRRLKIWQEAQPLLEKKRWRELMALTDQRALRLPRSLFSQQGIAPAFRETSGLVEQQALFQQSRD